MLSEKRAARDLGWRAAKGEGYKKDISAIFLENNFCPMAKELGQKYQNGGEANEKQHNNQKLLKT